MGPLNPNRVARRNQGGHASEDLHVSRLTTHFDFSR
jgi:hypothetical protein